MMRKLKLYLDNAAWSKIKVLLHDLDEFLGGLGPGPVVVHREGERLGNPDGVGDLDQTPPAQSGSHQALSNPSGSVGRAPVHLGAVLPGESSSSVSSPPPVGVHDDLPAGQPGVPQGASDDEVAAGVDVVIGAGQILR